MLNAVWMAVAAAAAGVLAGPPLRSAVFHHSVPAGTEWRTRCPGCEVPIVRPGWRLFTGGLRPTGRCGHCGRRIGPFPGSVEVVGAVAAGLLGWRLGAHPGTLALVWAALVGVALGFVDVAVHRLPDRLVITALTGTLAFLGVAVAAGEPASRLLTAVGCGLGAGAAYFILVFASANGFGLGDAKLAVLVGLATGWFGVWVTVYAISAGMFLAGFAALGLLALRRVGRGDRIAHGPYMLAGALIAIAFAH